MSVATPTILPRRPPFPTCMPQLPEPYPTPLPVHERFPGRLNHRRDLEKEFAEMSAEEEEVEKLCEGLSARGYKFIVPIGRMFTQEEERADETSEDEDDDDDDPAAGGSQSEASESGDGEEAGRDLDASLRDLDASADITGVISQTDPSGLSLLTEEEADDENDDSEEDIED